MQTVVSLECDVKNIDRVRDIVNYIETNVCDDISLDAIAGYSGLSKYYIHRIFKELTNKTLIDYVRSRKLAHSLNELLHSDFSILDIALTYRFSHEQSYIRCFKKQFGITPAKCRKQRRELYIENKIDLRTIHPIQDNIIVEPKYMMKHAMTLVGCSYVISQQDDADNRRANQLGKSFYYQYRDEIQTIKDTEMYMALVKLLPDCPSSNEYIPSFEVESIGDLGDNLVVNHIPQHTYAVFKYIGAHSPTQLSIHELRAIYDYIFHTWMPSTSNVCPWRFHIERINNRVCREDYCEMEIFVPIGTQNEGA